MAVLLGRKGGGSGGGGSLPDPSGEPDGDVLTVSGGAAVWSPGGGSLPGDENWALYGGGVVEVSGPGAAYLTLTSLGDGASLLDLSVPDTPTVVDAGVYAVTAMLQAHLLPEGTAFQGTLHLDADDKDAVATMSGIGYAANGDVEVSGSCTFYIPAGGQIRLRAFNFGGAPADFEWDELVVQRLS